MLKWEALKPAWRPLTKFGILLASLLILTCIQTQPKLLFKCDSIECVKALDQKENIKQSTVLESINLSFNINSHDSFKSDPTKIGAIQLKIDSGKLYVLIPMRYGKSLFSGVELSTSESLDENIRVDIVNSQSYFVYVNNKLAYSHRYQLPVFYISDLNYLQDQIGAATEKKIKVEAKLFSSSRIWTDIHVILFILMGLGIGIIAGTFLKPSFLPKKSEIRIVDRNSRWPFTIWPFYVVFVLWMLRIGLWLSKPIDPTGTSSPSPFGPSGPYFSDIFQVVQAGNGRRPYDLNASSYPTLMNAISRFLHFLSPTNIALIFLVFTSLAWTYCLYIATNKSLIKIKYLTSISVLLALPMLFGLFRGNVDLLVSGLVGASVFALILKKENYFIGLMALGIALKYWPALILLFLFSKIGIKVFLKTLLLSASVSIGAAFIIGYYRILDVVHALFVPVVSYAGANSTSQLPYSYSMKTLLFLLGIGLKARNFIIPTAPEISAADKFSTSQVSITLIIIMVVILCFLAFKSKRISSVLLFGSAAALLSTGTSYTYRATALLVVLLMRIFENQTFWRFLPRNSGARLRDNSLTLLEYLSWICILSPLDFVYANNSLVSIESFVQPLAVLGLCVIESVFIGKDGSFRNMKGLDCLRFSKDKLLVWDKIE
jgi:hypothetical protein